MKLNWRIENPTTIGEQLEEWWKEREFVMSRYLLPNTLFVVSNEVEDLYIIPVYSTDSEFAWMGFPTGNPNLHKVDKLERKKALVYLFDKIETVMKSRGHSRIITTTMNKTIEEVLEDRVFTNAETTNFYIKIV